MNVAAEDRLSQFYLTGGTALAAYYLNHRVSDDLDFFVQNDPDIIFLKEFAERLKDNVGAHEVLFERLYDRNQFFFKIGEEELKVEFTKYPFKQLEEPGMRVRDGIRIDSLRDISANKLMAMLDRFDPKDFVDLYFILQNTSLVDVRKDAETKFDMKIGDIFLGGEFVKVRRIEALPRMIKRVEIGELKSFFADRARELSPVIFKN
ncbi:MAG: hypothetical protein UX43_C0014G0007 [Candidatus Giovannonibacteria bacterium GW2011_GWB1_46_20]|nr:MAG: hypothetical protein UW15_C0032G0003 [Parcubacteria group bacterium GW2011_GWC1_44_10]KKT59039.1 MAG: hypothetical protein UW53_C0024G0007 [Candidatus Giovannonibacteria bacterium GW2011_GWA1_44_25]KKU29232.1 MAG: hypothetical protein UX43_C0014G0007 [Candidatus Giovannonibacteria bacterium GW2011_GWB1_46_20]OGF49893.1 MAG: hypothetical protein A2120_04360 [Candidatus Giovannonibacteria bacterium GWA2_45_15]